MIKYRHLIPDEAINVEMQLIFLKTTLENFPPEDGGHLSNFRTFELSGNILNTMHGKQIFRSALMLYRIAHVLPVVTARPGLSMRQLRQLPPAPDLYRSENWHHCSLIGLSYGKVFRRALHRPQFYRLPPDQMTLNSSLS